MERTDIMGAYPYDLIPILPRRQYFQPGEPHHIPVQRTEIADSERDEHNQKKQDTEQCLENGTGFRNGFRKQDRNEAQRQQDPAKVVDEWDLGRHQFVIESRRAGELHGGRPSAEDRNPGKEKRHHRQHD